MKKKIQLQFNEKGVAVITRMYAPDGNKGDLSGQARVYIQANGEQQEWEACVAEVLGYIEAEPTIDWSASSVAGEDVVAATARIEQIRAALERANDIMIEWSPRAQVAVRNEIPVK